VDKVRHITQVLAADHLRREAFRRSLIAYGYREEDEQFYGRRFIQRRPMGLTAVDASFPAITRSMISSGLGELALRVGAIQYEVNVDGLVMEEGAGAFAMMLEGRNV
jgi:hypothetical protein